MLRCKQGYFRTTLRAALSAYGLRAIYKLRKADGWSGAGGAENASRRALWGCAHLERRENGARLSLPLRRLTCRGARFLP